MTALLMIDFESTGLDIGTVTLLEGAWAVCEPDGTQRSALQQRFLAVGSGLELPTVPQARGWTRNGVGANPAALQMAVESGLTVEWLAASEDSRVRTGPELSRLILDHVAQACAPEETVHVAGAGVAGYDLPILAGRCPALRRRVHYRAVDVSVACTTLWGVNRAEDVRNAYLAAGGDGSVALAGSPYCMLQRTAEQVTEWVADGAEPHRAAADVARAMVTQRGLWTMVGEPLQTLLEVKLEHEASD